MYTDLIKKYYNVIDYLYKLSREKTEISEFSKISLIDFINGLYAIEKNNRELYEKLFENLELDKEKLIDINNENIETKNEAEDKKFLDIDKEKNVVTELRPVSYMSKMKPKKNRDDKIELKKRQKSS